MKYVDDQSYKRYTIVTLELLLLQRLSKVGL